MFGMMRKVAALLMILAIVSPGLSSDIAVVAINVFENETQASPAQLATLRSRITDSIINTRKFQVVERQNLATVMSELRLAQSGVTNPETAPEGGQIIGAGYVIYGSVLSLGRDTSAARVGGLTSTRGTAKVEIQMRIADASTAKILASKTIIGTGSQARVVGEGQQLTSNLDDQILDDAVREAARGVTEALLELAFPAKVLRISNGQLTINLPQEMTSVGSLYQIWRLEEELFDPDTGESLGAAEELAGEVRIVSSQPRFAIAEPVGGSDSASFSVGMIARRISAEALKEREDLQRQQEQQQFRSRF